MKIIFKFFFKIAYYLKYYLKVSWIKLKIFKMPEQHPQFGSDYKPALRAILRASELSINNRFYTIGSVLGALQAKFCGYKNITLIEFGVASGKGMRSLLKISKIIKEEMNISVSVVGFDNREGLPDPLDYRDHPEIWDKEQFAMAENFENLDNYIKSLDGKLVIGDVKETLNKFELNDQVLAFASIDVDYYSSTIPIINWLKNLNTANTLPASVLYFDDVLKLWTYSKYAGEELAIENFNNLSVDRKIELKSKELKLYAMHNFSHPIRTGEKKPNIKLNLFVDYLNKFHP